MGWLPAFIFLYAVLYLFERKRMTLDWFLIIVVALAPAMLYGLKLFISMLVTLPALADIAVELATYPITFLLLWKFVGLGKGRAGAYTGGLFAFQLVLGVLIFLATGQT